MLSDTVLDIVDLVGYRYKERVRVRFLDPAKVGLLPVFPREILTEGFRDRLDKHCDMLTESFRKLCSGRIRVLERIVEKRGDNDVIRSAVFRDKKSY